MNRKLLKQMLNEWRSNLWIVVEFLVVSVVMWYIADYFYATASIYTRDRGFNTDHCYLLSLYEVTEKSPMYVEGLTPDDMAANKLEIMERLQRRPEVEAVSYSNCSYHYNGSNSYIGFRADTIWGNGLRRVVTPDFVKVFRYEGVDGETPEELARQIQEGKVLFTDNFFSRGSKLGSKKGPRMSQIDRNEVYASEDTTDRADVGSALKPMRYSDYSTWDVAALLGPAVAGGDRALLWMNELCIRVRPDMDKDIIDNLMDEAQSQFHVGNYLLTNVQSFDDIRRNFQRDDTNRIRNYVTGMCFLLLNIFLGLLGIFWFRTQQRVREIALRKVNGATGSSVFRRLVSEGLLLLAISTVPAIIVDFVLAKYEMNAWADGYFGWGRLLLCAAIAFVLMALMVVLGIWFPARRAMKVDPARALADE